MNLRPLFGVVIGLVAAGAFGASPSVLISGTPRLSATAAGGSIQPVLSPDGRFVAFVSSANNLVTNDSLKPYLDVFLRDRLSGAIVLASVSTNGAGGGDDHSLGPSVSADGRFVAFQGAAGDLATNDTNGLSDVFLRDTVAGTTLLVSRQLDGWTAPGRASTAPLLSSNGRWLVFESAATNLVANDTNGAVDVFLFDRQTGSNTLVSVNETGDGSRAGASQAPHMTPDGRFVAFVNFVSNANPVVSHVFVHDRQAGTTLWASSNAAVQLGSLRGVAHPTLSADGSAVFFHAQNSVTTNLYRCALADGATALISAFTSRLAAPSPSADGRFVAFESNGVVRVADTQAGTNGLASVTQAGAPAPSPQIPARPVLSADGRTVCFLSSAASLTANPTNGMAQLYLRDLEAGVTLLLSKDPGGAASGDLSAGVPAMSTDGGTVVFESTSSAMVADDFNAAPDVFARDVATGTTTLISRRQPALPSGTAVAPAMVFSNGISANGRYVAFGAFDNGRFPADTNDAQDAFVRDLVTGTVQPINIGPGGALTNGANIRQLALSANGRHAAWVMPYYPPGSAILWRDLDAGLTRVVSADPTTSDFTSTAPTITADGRWVAFQTTQPVSLFEPGFSDGNGASDIILKDMMAGTNTVISRTRFVANPVNPANRASSAPQFSPDGRWLAFASAAGDLSTNVLTAGTQHLFVRDLASRAILGVSALISNANGYAGGAKFSSSSRYLVFQALSNQVAVFDLVAVTGAVVRTGIARNLSISADGRFVAMEDPIARRLVLLDRQLGQETLVGSPGLQSYHPLLSGDGRRLVFLSRSVAGDAVELPPSLFVHHVATGVTQPLPVSMGGGSGDGPTYLPQLAANDHTLVFTSFASDLFPGDYNSRRDVFVLQIERPDSDGDGMEDDLEVAYFGNLSRSGFEDMDGDGHSDGDELLAGTDPTNQGSILRALTVTSVTGGATAILWSAVPGRHYVVEFKDQLADSWAPLPGEITAAATTTAWKLDTSTPRPANRFYRVMLVP